MSSLPCNLVWLLSLEKTLLHKDRMLEMEAGFSLLLWQSGYSILTLIQNVWRFEVVSNILLWPLSFAISSSWSFSSTKSIHLAYSQMGWGSIPSQFRVLLWVGSNAQTLLKAETGDHAPAGRKKALAQSPSKSLLMSETCQKSQCSLIVPIIPAWLWMQPPYLPTWTVVLSWSDRLSSLSRLNMSHK